MYLNATDRRLLSDYLTTAATNTSKWHPDWIPAKEWHELKNEFAPVRTSAFTVSLMLDSKGEYKARLHFMDGRGKHVVGEVESFGKSAPNMVVLFGSFSKYASE